MIVNIDADNQCDARDLPLLVGPILRRESEFVIGARPIGSRQEFSLIKKIFQKLGSSVVRMASNTTVLDAPSGFRALSRHAAARINIYDHYTYTLESIIQAGLNGIEVMSVPIRVNSSARALLFGVLLTSRYVLPALVGCLFLGQLAALGEELRRPSAPG